MWFYILSYIRKCGGFVPLSCEGAGKAVHINKQQREAVCCAIEGITAKAIKQFCLFDQRAYTM